MSVCDNSGEDQPSRGVVHTAGGGSSRLSAVSFFSWNLGVQIIHGQMFTVSRKVQPCIGLREGCFFPPCKIPNVFVAQKPLLNPSTFSKA